MPTTDDFTSFMAALNSPASKAVAITPNNGADLAFATRGIYIGVGGD